MKLNMVLAIVVTLGIFGIWLSDIANDRTKSVKITETVLAYNDWKCGYQNQSGCSVVFEVEPNLRYDVKRIRYGKDFMAIKIVQDNLSGWVYSGPNVKISVGPNT